MTITLVLAVVAVAYITRLLPATSGSRINVAVAFFTIIARMASR